MLEAALGLGAEPNRSKGQKRATSTVACGCHAPCQAIVIENLKHYRPDVHKLRRENRGLAMWASAKVEKHLTDQCKLAGIHLISVQANYTSRQDSRTGSPGARCADVRPEDLLHPKSELEKLIKTAEENEATNKATDFDRLLLSYLSRWSDHVWTDLQGRRWKYEQGGSPKWTCLDPFPAGKNPPKVPNPVRLPMPGGEFFLSVHPASPDGGIHADLNAAANIALKALFHPNLPSRYWYVPTSTKELGLVDSSRLKGSTFENHLVHLKLEVPPDEPVELDDIDQYGTAKKKKSKARKPGASRSSIVNFWRDPSGDPDIPTSGWRTFDQYWPDVTQRVARRLLQSLPPIPKEIPDTSFQKEDEKINF